MDILEVLAEVGKGGCKSKDDVRPFMKDVLKECFGDPETVDGDEVVYKFKTFDNFVDVVLAAVFSMNFKPTLLKGDNKLDNVLEKLESIAFDILDNWNIDDEDDYDEEYEEED